MSGLHFLYSCAALPRLAKAASARSKFGTLHLDWQQFVDHLEDLAKEQHRTDWDQAVHVREVAALQRGFNSDCGELAEAMKLRRSFKRSSPDFADLVYTMDVQVSLITFDAGESLPHHDHPGMTGVLTSRCP